MDRGWHYVKLSLSNAPRLSFSGLCILLFLFLSLCRFLCVCAFLLLSLEQVRRCSSDLFLPSRPRSTGFWQPRILLGMVEARSVNNVKKTTTTTTTQLKIPCSIIKQNFCSNQQIMFPIKHFDTISSGRCRCYYTVYCILYTRTEWPSSRCSLHTCYSSSAAVMTSILF